MKRLRVDEALQIERLGDRIRELRGGPKQDSKRRNDDHSDMRVLKTLAFSAYAVVVLGLATAAAQAQSAPAQPAPAKAEPSTGTAYRIYADVVTSGTSKGVQGVVCVNQDVFFPGDLIVFRAVISDGATGVELTAADVTQRGLQVVATLSDGTKVPLTLKAHPPVPNAPVHESYWTGTLVIHADHPTGTLPWALTASDNQGHTGTFTPVGQAAGEAVLTIAQKGPAAAK
jgi:hypothetical protein